MTPGASGWQTNQFVWYSFQYSWIKKSPMTDSRTATQELQSQILDSIRTSQEAVVDALRT